MNSQVEQVKQATDLVALISEHVKLTKAGKNFKGLCPFHSEKSPSFFVSPDMGRYKCFGCQESGDCFTFLMKHDALSFSEALKELARRTGITLQDIPVTQEDKTKERLLALLSLAREYYHYLLTDHQVGEPARSYCLERGLKKETITLFGIGYAAESWDGLLRYLVGKKGYSTDEVVNAGLAIRSDTGRTYDRFRGRLMFPLTNPRGQVVGFSGRLLLSDAKEAKYINTPETTLYHKSELLFGFSQLSRMIRQREEVIVCEGEFDVLSSVQASVPNVVAIKGSALSQQQILFLSRSVKRILFALDADAAGIEATKRAIHLTNESGAQVSLRVIPLSGGKDPDDLARNSPALWRSAAQASVSVYEYLIDVAFQTHDVSSGDGKREITKELGPLLAGIRNAVEQAHYVQLVARRLGVREEILLTELKKIALPFSSQERSLPVAEKPKQRKDILSRYLFALALVSPESMMPARVAALAEVPLEGIWAKLRSVLAATPQPFDLRSFGLAVPEELRDTVLQLTIEGSSIEGGGMDAEFVTTAEQLRQLVSKDRRQLLRNQISVLEEKENLTVEEENELHVLRTELFSLTEPQTSSL